MKTKLTLNLSLGLNNNADPATFSPDRAGRVYLSGCNNVVIGDTGRVERCLGQSIYERLPGAHSLYAIDGLYAYVFNGELRLSNNAIFPLVSAAKMSYAKVDDRVFFSNGTDMGFIRGGEILPMPSWEYHGPKTARNFSSAVPGHLLCYTLGRLLIASGNTLWMSEAAQPYTFCLSDSRFQYNSKIRLLAKGNSGFWVSDSEGIYWVDYKDGQWEQTIKAFYPALEGEPSYVNATEVQGLENLFGTACLCATVKGICLLGADGIFVNLTEKVLELRDSEGVLLPLVNFAGIVHRNRYYVSMGGRVKVGIILNLYNRAVTQHTLYQFTSVAAVENKVLGTYEDGIFTLFETWPRVNSSFTFYVNTDKLSRFRFLNIHGEFYDDIEVSVTCDEKTTWKYTGEVRNPGMLQHEFKLPIARDNGIGTYWKVEVKNINGRYFAVNRITADVIYRR